MGKTYSRSQDNKGDAQVNVYNALEAHCEAHEGHEIKLWLILSLALVQVTFTLYKQYVKAANRRAIKAARSLAGINNIWTLIEDNKLTVREQELNSELNF